MRFRTLLSTGFGLFLGLGLVAPASAETLTRTLTLSPHQVVLTPTPLGVAVTVPGGVRDFVQGEPDLPRLPVRFEVPAGRTATDVRVTVLEWSDLPGSHRPAPMPLPRAEEGMAVEPVRGLAADAWYPEVGGTLDTGRMRGREIAVVPVAQVQWLPGEERLRVATRVRIEVDLAEAPRREGDLVILRESDAGRRTFARARAELLDRPAAELLDAQVGTVTSAPFSPTFRPSVDGSAVEMVIVTSADQVAEYQRLADFRTRTGLTTVVRSMDWVKTHYPDGVDGAETLRLFIRDAASKWGTAYILIGGDTGVMPFRYGYTNFYTKENIPTDLYFSDLDGTWNADGDGVFGEGNGGVSSPGDQVDMYPDVWVGRLPSYDAMTAARLVDRAIGYEATPPLGYQTDALFLGEVLFPQNWHPGDTILSDGAELCESAIDSLVGGINPVRLYENYTVYPGSILEQKQTVIDSINAGFNLVHHVGHGYINTMAVGKDGGSLSNGDADAFTNGDERFLLYAINCTSSAIDFNCLTERFLLAEGGGAVASVGSTRLDFPGTGEIYQNDFYSELFQKANTRLGVAFALSKVPSIPFASVDNSHRWIQFSLIYLGDPALDYYTAVPESLMVSHPDTLVLGTGTVALDVTRDGLPAAGVLVTLHKDGDARASGLTDGAGHVELSFDPDLTGTFWVGARAHNSLPYLAEVPVVAPVGDAYLFASAQEILDDGTLGTAGNGDGKMEAGETVRLGFVLDNSGDTGETGITGVLSTVDPWLTILDDTSAWPDIAAGASASPTDAFLVQVDANAPDRVEAVVTLAVTAAGGNRTEDELVYLHAPVLQYYHQTLRDTVGNGNGNGTIEANEDFAILPTLFNWGQGEAGGVELRLRSTDGAVTLVDTVAVLGDIPSFSSASNPADGLAARFADLDPHELTVVAIDQLGVEFLEWPIEITPPPATNEPIAFGGATTITLEWEAVDDSTLWGYNIYRSNSELGPFVRVNETTTERTAYYADEGLPGLTRYYYYVRAIDLSGNESPPSTVVSVTTSLPVNSGWPVHLIASTTAGISFANADSIPGLEIFGGGNELYGMHPNGDEIVDGDGDARTLGPITKTSAKQFWNTPAVADIDGDGISEIAAVSWSDRKLYMIQLDGTIEPNWNKNVNPNGVLSANPLGSVVFADIEGDGFLEVFVQVANLVFAWHHDGTELIDGDANPATDGVFAVTGTNFSYGTPTIADIDGNGIREIIAGMRDGNLYVWNANGTSYPGFPIALGGDITSSPAVADIDNNGQVEIIVGSSNSLLHAIRADTSTPFGWPTGIQLMEDVDSSPAIGDLNNDGKPDVVIGASNGQLFAFSGANGIPLPGFPVLIRDNEDNPVPVRSSPVIADVNGNGVLDIVVGDQIGRLHGITASGGLLPGFPIQTGNLIENAPAVWDFDSDGKTEVMVASFDGYMYMYDTPWEFSPARAPWPMFKRNARNTGVYDEAIFAIVDVPTTVSPLAPTPLLLQNFPNPLRGPRTTLAYRVPEGGPALRPVTLRVFDIRGRLVRTLVDEDQAPGLFEIDWDGRDAYGRTVPSGIYPYRLDVSGQALVRKLLVVR